MILDMDKLEQDKTCSKLSTIEVAATVSRIYGALEQNCLAYS
jgi:hypothetical protein